MTKPLNLILAIVLTWKLIGWPCLIGVLTVAGAQVVNIVITRALLRNEKKRRMATDTKLKKITQFVGAIRHLRWYGWQEFWQEQIMQARQNELNLRIVTGLWVIAIGFTTNLASGMFPVAAFYAYTVLAGKPLRIDVAFPALQLFTMLENSLREIPGLIVVLLNANVAVGRIESFMNEENKEDSMMKFIPKGTPEITLRGASFAWPGTPHMVLYDVDLVLSLGLTLVYGKVAAGKTALLQAMLGELDKTKGSVSTPNEMIGYCAQTPWLQSMSIRENILFSFPYDEARYRNVLEVCALTQDLADFKHGDLSNIGENGIGLSGGQRARVALARAVYSPARILLLDDPISALDLQTAETVIRRCLSGSLMEGRMVVLVTHRTEVCYKLADKVIEVSEGRTRTVAKEAMALTGLNSLSETHASHLANSESHERDEKIDVPAQPDKFIEDEHRAHGDVKASVYWEYIKAGKLRWWAILILVLALYRLIAVGETWFLKSWGEAYDQPSERIASTVFPHLPSPSINIKPWLVGFFVLAVAQASAFLISQCFMLVIIYSAGREMFKNIMDRVSHATFRFYDVTPVGRLMNRMTSDIGTVDGNISQQFQDVAFLAITWITSVVVIASVTPVFLIFSFALTAGFIAIFLKFLPTSQSLRRLEVSRVL